MPKTEVMEEDELIKYYEYMELISKPSVIWIENDLIQNIFLCANQAHAEQFALDLGKKFKIYFGDNYNEFLDAQIDNGGCINGIEIYVENTVDATNLTVEQFFTNLEEKF